MTISPFTPLFFSSGHKTDGIESDYIQTFSTKDRILFEMFVESDSHTPYNLQIYDELNQKSVCTVPFQKWEINEETTLWFQSLSFSPGYYHVNLSPTGMTSDVFRVTDDPNELAKTTLIQYSMKNNRQRTDAVFFIDHMQYFFDFRVHGGFKDSGWSFNVESEQFVTQQADIAQLYGLESTQKTFTLGGSMGVPIWFGEMLNRILVCSHVYFDGVKYTRKDASVPEVAQQLEGHNSFVFSQTLQRSVYLDPKIEAQNEVSLRRYDPSFQNPTPTTLIRKI